MNEKKSKNLVAFVPRIADTTHMETSEKNFVRGFAIVCAIMATMIVGVYWIEQNTKSPSKAANGIPSPSPKDERAVAVCR